MHWLSKGHSFLQKTVLGFIILCVVTFFYTGQEIVFYMRFGNDFKCHQSEEKDVLPSADNTNFSPEANSIFFHETSCRSSLSARQACAIESAARIHPNKQIYVLFSSPISEDTLRNNSLAKLSSYLNINFARVHIAENARNTPLEELVANKEFYRSMWWVEHTSDVLRSLTLYKWGGVYLDMDMLVVKSLTSLGNNWVAKEIPVLVNGAAIAISKDRVGRKLINAIVDVQLQDVQSKMFCYHLEDEDALPAAEDFNFFPRPNSIFFHETSCRGSLTPRQACSIESAARANPQREIYVLFSAPVNEHVITSSNLAQLKSFANIKVARVHLEKYAERTPLEEMVKNKPFEASKWWVEHTSDVLRCLTLYKWGGVYLDTDIFVAKSLAPLGHNWAVKEDSNLVNAAAIAISTDHFGRRLANAFINELRSTYRPDIWAHNGPGAITRVLHKLCNTHHMAEWSPVTCGGLDVYGPEYFFPVHYSDYQVYFQPGELEEEEKNAYAYHLWNKLTYNLTAEKGSPLLEMAEKFCPTIFQTYGDKL